MKKITYILIAAVIGSLLGITSCTQQNIKYVFDGFTQGTTYHIAYYSNKGEVVSQQEIDKKLERFSKSCSIFDKSSLISALNSNQSDSLDKNILECIEYAKHFNKISDGKYDITIKPLIKAYGFIDHKAVESVVNVDSILQFVGMNKISVVDNKLKKSDPRVEIDLNSIAQGYSVDMISKLLEDNGIANYIVEIGGEIYAKGMSNGREWRVGVDKPVDGSNIPGEELQAVIPITNKGLTTSGNYRKFFKLKSGERVNHTIDPTNGKSSDNGMLSVTVIADNATLADGYTTTFMLMGKDKAVEYLNNNKELDALIVYVENGTIKTYITERLKKIIEMKN